MEQQKFPGTQEICRHSKEWNLEKRKDFSISMLFFSLVFAILFSPPAITVFVTPATLYFFLTKLPMPNELFGYLKTRIITGVVVVIVISLTTYLAEFILDQMNLSDWETFFLRIFSEVCIGASSAGIVFFSLLLGYSKEIKKKSG